MYHEKLEEVFTTCRIDVLYPDICSDVDIEAYSLLLAASANVLKLVSTLCNKVGPETPRLVKGVHAPMQVLDMLFNMTSFLTSQFLPLKVFYSSMQSLLLFVPLFSVKSEGKSIFFFQSFILFHFSQSCSQTKFSCWGVGFGL